MKNPTEGKTTNLIAYIVLVVFSTLLLTILFKAWSLYNIDDFSNAIGQASDAELKVYEDSIAFAESWLSLFKDGFLLLGGALTTLIGYYFGNRNSDTALATSEKIKEEAEKLLKEIEKEAPTTDEDETGISTIQPTL